MAKRRARRVSFHDMIETMLPASNILLLVLLRQGLSLEPSVWCARTGYFNSTDLEITKVGIQGLAAFEGGPTCLTRSKCHHDDDDARRNMGGCWPDRWPFAGKSGLTRS